MVGDAPHREGALEHHGAHAVPAGDVPGAALGHVPAESDDAVRRADRVEVVAVDGEQAGAPVVLLDGDAVLRAARHHDDAFVARRVRGLGERAGGVPRGGDDYRAAAAIVQARVGGQRLHLLERAGLDLRAPLRVVPGESHGQVGEPQLLREPLAPERHRRRLRLDDGAHREPVVEAEHPAVRLELQPLRRVLGPQQPRVLRPARQRVVLLDGLSVLQADELVVPHPCPSVVSQSKES